MVPSTSIKPLSSLERRLRLKPSLEQLEQLFEQSADKVAREAKLPGFRPGKVPRSLIKERYREDLLQEVHSHEVREAMQYAEHLEDVNLWKITHVDVDKPEDLNQTEYIIDFVEQPVLELSQIESLNLCVPNITVDEPCLERIETLYRYDRATGTSVGRPVQHGDRVTVELEDIASQLAGDVRSTPEEQAQEYLGKHHINMDQRLYDHDQLGALLHEEILNRSVGDEFVVDKQIPSILPGSNSAQVEIIPEETRVEQSNVEDEASIDTSVEDDTQTKVTSQISVISWYDSERLPKRHLHATVRIVEVEELNSPEIDDDFFARDDIPYNNFQALHEELKQYANASAEQGALDAQLTQVTAQICALNPVDLPVRVLMHKPSGSKVTDEKPELGATFVPDIDGVKHSDFSKSYFSILEGIFIQQYAKDNNLEPTDESIAEFSLHEYERLGKLGLDPDRVFEPEYQNIVRNNFRCTRVIANILERNNAPEVTMSYFDFLFLSRIGWWTLPPKGGPFNWDSPVSAEEIQQTLEEESLPDESEFASMDELNNSVEAEATSVSDEPGVSSSRHNSFTNWFKKKIMRSGTKKKNDD